MNIIHIGDIRLEANGVGQVISNLTTAQRRLGNSVIALTTLKKKDELPIFKEIHKKSDFCKIIDEHKPDIFVFHSLYIWDYIKFYKYLINRNIPYLIQLHGALSRVNYKKGHLKKFLANSFFYNTFIRRAESIIYLNQNEFANSIVKTINPNSLLIPNGCTISEENIVYPILEKIEILYLGRIDLYYKGLDVLFKAIHILYNSELRNEIHFSFYGTGEISQVDSFCETIKSYNGFADFYGGAYGELKENVYRKSHVFILTSRSEGMPMGVLEALAHGIPCIVTSQTNMTDVISAFNCGWISELNPNSIAKSIVNAVSEYKKNQNYFYKQSLEAAHSLSWDKIAERTIEIYNTIIYKRKNDLGL